MAHHTHNHDHKHDHHHSPSSNIKIAIFLNIFFTIIEIIGGLWTNSLAILSDALHDLGDSISLIGAWFAEKYSKKIPDKKRTFGYKRISLFSALINSAVLITGSIFILSQTIPRLLDPQTVNAKGMVLLSIIGILFNGAGFFNIRKSKNLNEKIISLHLLEDVLGWIIVLIGSIVISIWHNYIIDPIITIFFTSFILWQVVKNLKEVINIFMQGVPKNLDINNIKKEIVTIENVLAIHDIHIWSLEGETNIFSAHIVIEYESLKEPDPIKKLIRKLLEDHGIHHSTLELESKGYCSGMECNDL